MNLARGVIGVALVALGLSPALARADETGVLTATLLPKVAFRVEADKPTTTFAGERLGVAADRRRNPIKESYLTFDLDAIPPNASVRSWSLRLYLQKSQDTKGRQLVRVFPAKAHSGVVAWSQRPGDDGAAVANAEVRADTPVVDFAHDVQDGSGWLKSRNGKLFLLMRSVSEDQANDYFSTSSADAACPTDQVKPARTLPCANVQPRLVVKYFMPVTPLAASWPQPGHDAQRTGRTPWRFNVGAGAVESSDFKVAYSPQGYVMGDPVVHAGTLYMHTQLVQGAVAGQSCADEPCESGAGASSGSGKFFVTAVGGAGVVRWSRDIEAAAKFTPAVDRGGRLYVATENHLRVLAASDGTIVKTVAWSDLLRSAGPVGVRADLTLGANGALYVSTTRGLHALTPYPDLTVAWRQANPAENAFGRITLGRDDATAYVVDGDSGRLVALDTVDGRQRWVGDVRGRCPADGAPARDQFKRFPSLPVVADGGLVYVTNGYYSGTCLLAFDAAGQPRGSVTADKRLRLSQPVVASTGVVRFIREQGGVGQGALCAWNAGPTPTCGSPGEALSPRSVLALDGDDRLYVIDRVSDPQRVRGYSRDGTRLFELGVPKTATQSAATSRNFRDNVLVASDGTLYTRNENHLFAIVIRALAPKTVSVTPGSGVGNGTAWLAQEAVVVDGDATLDPVKSIVVRSGGRITVKSGFRVVEGAELLFRIGF
jgi:outer membrane protein assembly factor BamB